MAGHLVSFLLVGEREVGYWLGKEFWGKGIATKALAEFLKIIETRPLYAHVAKHNIGSRRVLEKCGFMVIGEDKYMNRAREEVKEFVLKLEKLNATVGFDTAAEEHHRLLNQRAPISCSSTYTSSDFPLWVACHKQRSDHGHRKWMVPIRENPLKSKLRVNPASFVFPNREQVWQLL